MLHVWIKSALNEVFDDLMYRSSILPQLWDFFVAMSRPSYAHHYCWSRISAGGGPHKHNLVWEQRTNTYNEPH